MKITNSTIYQLASDLVSLANDNKIYIPAKANFFLQKNINVIAAAAQEIDKARIAIVQHYGKLSGDANQYVVSKEDIEVATKELNDLFAIEQDLDIKTIRLEDLGNAEFTAAQMQALMIMLEEGE